MKVKQDNNLTILTPADGYKYITNGTVFSDIVFLGKTDRVENWVDTNEEPPIEEQKDPTVEGPDSYFE